MNCPDCDRYMHNPKCPCGFVDPGPRKQKTEKLEKQAEEQHIAKSETYLGSYMADSKKEIALFKKEHGDDWQKPYLKMLRDRVRNFREKGLGRTDTRGDLRRANAKLVNETHGFKPHNEKIIMLMPAPHDLEGWKKYYEALKQNQGLFPPNGQKLGDRE